MNERRRFSRRERVALYLAADGRCAECGRELEAGWHADHRTPWSAGGRTDVVNGQALCPECNLRKGHRMTELRAWQDDALAKLLRSRGDFLTVATPGAGKTRFALVATQRLMELGQVRRVLVVVPTSHLREQWASAGAQLGVQLDHRFVTSARALARDFDGLVVTYAAVAAEPLFYRKISADVPSLVILDEVHHAGHSLAWGNALQLAFEPAERRLLLSGTPFRSDRAPIPFVRYDAAGRCKPDHDYDYGAALRDRETVRPVEFLALDGAVRWREAGSVVATALVDAEGDGLSNALGAALSPDGDWIASVLRRADAELSRHRSQVPDAGGLVIAADQDKARKYVELLRSINGEQPALAISDEPDASRRIAEFAAGSSRWIVAVQMISEGVDIPRLEVGVYASKTRTEMFFRQVVGRFVRMRQPDDYATATILVPSIEPLLRYAQDIQEIVDATMQADMEDARREAKERDVQTALRFDLVEPLDSSEAIHHATILGGESFTDAELRRANEVLASSPAMPGSLTPSHVAHLLRAAGMGQVVGTATITPAQKPIRRADEKHALRRQVQRLVSRLARLTEEEHKKINFELNRACGDTAATATMESLERRLSLLQQWIGQVADG